MKQLLQHMHPAALPAAAAVAACSMHVCHTRRDHVSRPLLQRGRDAKHCISSPTLLHAAAAVAAALLLRHGGLRGELFEHTLQLLNHLQQQQQLGGFVCSVVAVFAYYERA
jgi:hypothetical protein